MASEIPGRCGDGARRRRLSGQRSPGHLGLRPCHGTLPVPLAETLRPAPGPAGLLCHSHNEKLWNQTAIAVKGTLERRGGDWVFVSTAFTPPSRLAPVQTIKRVRASTDRYLAKRGLEPPVVNWAAIAEIWRRAARK